MEFAGRVQRIGESATLRVTRQAAELRAQGVKVVDFGAGEPDFDSPAVAVEAAQEALANGFTKYTPAAGIPDLRRALATRYEETHGAPWRAQTHAVVTVGAKAALFELALALFESGQEVIVSSPFWVSFPEQIRFAGARPVLVPTSGEDSFRIRAQPILDEIGDATRAVILNSPCNPTGGLISSQDLRQIVEACAERGILVISDETYERFVYDGQTHASAASLAAMFPDTVVLVGSFSKTYAMTGWRLGFALGPEPIIGAVAAIQSHATSNPTSFAMVGALAALRLAESDVARMIDEYQARRDLVVGRINAIRGMRCPPPAGAFYAFPKVADCYGPGKQGSTEFAEFLLNEAHVAVVPGIAFGNDDHVRLSFACSRQDLEEGLDRLAAVLG